jgi:hypothetical protein
MFRGGLYVAFTSLDTSPCAGNPAGTGTWALQAGRWVPGGAGFATGRPESVYTLASGPFTCNTSDPAYNQPGENLGIAAGVGRDLGGLDAFYVFSGPRNASGVTARRLVPAGGGLALQGTVSSTASGSAPWSIAVLPAAATGGVDELLLAGPGSGVGGDNASRVFRASGGPTPSAPAVAYAELSSDTFATADGFLFMTSDHNTIQTIDVSNPLDPQLVSTHGSDWLTYNPLVTAGRLLLSGAIYPGAAGYRVDLHEIQASGALVDRGSITVGNNVRGLALADGRLFVALGNQLSVYDVSQATDPSVVSPSYPLVTSLAVGAYAVDVRGSVIWVAGDSGGNSQLRAYTLSGTTLALAGGPLAVASAAHLSVRGTTAVVSSTQTSQIIDVSNPGSPTIVVSRADVAGPVAIHGGYVVGPAAAVSSGVPDSGPHFVALDGTFHGAQPFAGCGAQATYITGSFAWDRGTYVAYCGRNGVNLVTAVNPASGALADEVPFAAARGSDLTMAYSPLALEGATAFLGGTNGFYMADLRGLASGGGVGVPFRRRPDPETGHLVQAQGTLWTLYGWGSLGATEVWSLDTTNLVATGTPPDWPRLAQTQLSSMAHPTAPLVTDGQTLWAAAAECYGNVATGANLNCLSRGTGVHALDARSPASAPILASYAAGWSGAFTSLAYQRRSLYGAWTPNYPGGQFSVVVWDVSSATTPVRRTDVPVALSPYTPSGYVAMSRLRDLAVRGSLLVFTYDGGVGAPAYGMGFVRLGPAGDGTGATFLGTYESPLPLGSPVFAGDLLYTRHNAGLAAFDLRPYLERGALPRYIGSRKTAEITYTPSFARLEVEGPFAFLLANSLRVFDLR